MFFDGSLNINGAGARILFISPNKDKLRYVLRILFRASNNVTEYWELSAFTSTMTLPWSLTS